MKAQTGVKGTKGRNGARDLWRWVAISLLTMFLGMGVEYLRAGRDFDAVQGALQELSRDMRDVRERLARVEERLGVPSAPPGG